MIAALAAVLPVMRSKVVAWAAGAMALLVAVAAFALAERRAGAAGVRRADTERELVDERIARQIAIHNQQLGVKEVRAKLEQEYSRQ